MGFVKVKERRDGGISARVNGNRIDIVESYSYIVVTNDKATTRAQVLTHSDLPRVGISVTANGAVCNSLDGQRQPNNPFVWIVTAEFSSESSQEIDSSAGDQNDPRTWFPIWKGKLERTVVHDQVDATGQPFQNSAKQFFDGGMQLSDSVSCSSFFQFESEATTLAAIKARNNTTNSAAITSPVFGTFWPHTLLFLVDDHEFGSFFGYPAWRIEYTVKFKSFRVDTNKATFRLPDNTALANNDEIGWRYPALDHGFTQLDGSPCVDSQGRPIDAKLDQGNQKAYGDDPTYIVFDKYTPDPISWLRVKTS